MEQKSIKKNTIYSMLKTGSSILFPLITFPYISRVLLTENVGKINFGLSIVSYFSLIASLGITTYAIRECSGVRNNKEELNDTANQLYSINIITTVIAYVALALTLAFYGRLENYRLLIAVQSLSIIATTLGADWLNSAMEDFRYITLRTVAFQLLSLFLMFIFVRQPEDYMNYALISLVSSAGASIANIWYRKKYCDLRFTVAIQWGRHLAPILFLFVMILAQNIFNNVDSTMLGLMHGDREVGIYSAAHKISNMINQVVGSLLWVIMPRMSYYFAEKNFDEVNRLLRKVLGFNILFGLPCAVGCCIMSDDVVRVLAGDAFIEAAPVLQILMIGFIISLVGGNFLGNTILLPSKQEKYYMIVCCIAAVCNVVGNYALIPLFAAKAAAGVTAACSLIILVMLLFKIDKNVKIERWGRLIATPLIGCAGIVAVCFLCKSFDSLWVRVALSVVGSGAVYSIVQIVLKNELVTEVLFAISVRFRRS